VAPRVGLALSGGGAKGAFTVGALKVIRQKIPGANPAYPVLSGTSTGSLIATLLATNDWTTLVDIYSTVTTRNIVNPHYALVARALGSQAVLFAAAVGGGTAIYDTDALKGTIHNNVDFNKIKSAYPATLLLYSTIDLQTGGIATFNNRDHSAATLEKALLASASMPVLMDPVTISEGGATQQYVDGGVREFLPLGAIFGSGVELDLIIAISTAPLAPKPNKNDYTKIIDVLGRTIDLLDTEVGSNDYFGAQQYNALLRMVANAKALGISEDQLLKGVPDDILEKLADKRPVPVVLIAPKDHLDLDSLDFNPDAMVKLMDQGLATAKTALDGVL
jgi:NTE family protein